MATQGGFFKGEKKKKRKEDLAKGAFQTGFSIGPPPVEILGKKGKKKWQ